MSSKIDNMDNLGGRIKKIREQLALNQAQFAEQLGLGGPAAVSKYEKNQREPEIAVLVKIARMGNEPLDWLLTGKYPIKKTTDVVSDNVKADYKGEAGHDTRLMALIEKLTVVYTEGTDIQRAALRGLLDNMLDDLSDILKKKREPSTAEPVGAVEKKE